MNFLVKKPLVAAIAAAVGILTPFGQVMAGNNPIDISDQAKADSYVPVYVPFESREESAELSSAIEATMLSTASATSTTVRNLGTLSAIIYTIPGYPVSAQKTLKVRITLTGGATFKDKPYLICAHSAAAATVATTLLTAITWGNMGSGFVGVAAAATNGLTKNDSYSAYVISHFEADVIGKSTVSFALPQDFNTPAGDSGSCIVTFGKAIEAVSAAVLVPPPTTTTTAYQVAMSTKTVGSDVSMSVETIYQDLFNSVTVTATVPMIKAVTAYKIDTIKISSAGVTGYAMIDVNKSSKEFLRANGSSNSDKAFVGQVRLVKANASVTELRSPTGKVVSAGDIIPTASITISGPTISKLSKVTLEANNKESCDGTLIRANANVVVASGSSSDATVSFSIGDSPNDAYKALIAGAEGSIAGTTVGTVTGLSVCLNNSGKNQLDAGAVTISIIGVKGTTQSELGSGELATVQKNGTVLRVLNIPNSTLPERAFIRFYNSGSQPFNVTGTLYSEKGELIGTEGMALFTTDLGAGEVKSLGAPELEKLAGKAWTGRAWMIIQAPISSDFFKVQATIRTPNTAGYLTNSSTDAMD